jgi:surface antigen
MFPRTCLAAMVLAVALAGCASNPDAGAASRENTSTLMGAPAGAGGNTGSDGVAATAVGGLIGNRIAALLNDTDRERAYAAQIQALESGQPGAPVNWSNPESGHRGTVVPGPAYRQAGANCRSYTHTVYIDGRPQTARKTACRNSDRTWNPMS